MNLDISSDLRTKLELVSNGYPVENFSVGRLMIYVLDSKELDLDLTKDELKEIGEIIRTKRNADFHSAVRHLESIVESVYGREMPSYDDSSYFTKIDTEYDFLRYLVEKKKVGKYASLPQYTKNQIAILEENLDDNEVKKLASRPVNLYVMDPRRIGIPLDLIAYREKTDTATGYKGIERKSQSIFPSIDLRKLHLTLKELRDVVSSFIVQSNYSGQCFQDFFEDSLMRKPFLFNIIKDSVERRYLVDSGGAKVSGSKKEIIYLNRYLGQKGRSQREIKFRYENCFKNAIKDMAIVRAYKGSNVGEYHEVRLQPFREALVLGEFGRDPDVVKAHYLYKGDSFKDLAWQLLAESDFYNGAKDLSVALGFKLEDLLNLN